MGNNLIKQYKNAYVNLKYTLKGGVHFVFFLALFMILREVNANAQKVKVEVLVSADVSHVQPMLHIFKNHDNVNVIHH